MRRTNGGKFSNSFDSSFIDEFNALESALNAEIDSLSPRSPLSHQSSTRIPNSSELTSRVLQSHSTAFADHNNSDSEKQDESTDTADPPGTKQLPIEDPFLSYDSVVSQMVADGVEWIPIDQMNKKLSEVRLVAPDSAKHAPKEDLKAFSRTEKPTDITNKTTSAQHPTDDSCIEANHSSIPESVSKLKELQYQLNQEKATRKQQEDYIQQLQRYYDNLLAKHAAAEMTIDHLRFRAKVGGEEAQMPPNSQNLTPLRSRKLISASLDTCAPIPLGRTPLQPRFSGSLMTFREKEPVTTPLRPRGSLNTNNFSNSGQRPSLQPQVHLMPLSSVSLNQLEQNRPASGAVSTNRGFKNANNREGVVSSSGEEFNADTPRKLDSNTDNTSQDAARALENQLNASLAAIHDRLNAIEARLSDNNKNETLMAIHRDLEDLRRKYQAGQYLWSDGGLFDNQAMIGSRLNCLSQRLQRMEDHTRDDTQEGRACATPVRPSSLSLGAEVQRPLSSNSTSAPSVSSSGSAALRHEGSSSSPSESARLSPAVGSTTSRETVEAHFTRLLARYNKLKGIPGHEKDVESLMQRMLQLSARYCSQSSVILPPRSLRQMFEQDYSINTSVNGAILVDSSSLQTYPHSTASKTLKNGHVEPRQMVSPDSGVAQTPLGSSGSSGASFYGTADYRRRRFIRQVPSVAAVSEAPIDSPRKQSDSGFWATDSCSGGVPPHPPPSTQSPMRFESVPSVGTTNTDDLDTDTPIRLSKTLPNDVASLEADIQQLRQGIARLTSTSSVSSAPRFCETGSCSDSSSSTCEENPSKKNHRRPMNGGGTLGRTSKRSGFSSANLRKANLPVLSSSSDEEAVCSPYPRPRYPSRSRHHHNAAVTNTNIASPLEVVGSALTPQRRPPARTYQHRAPSRSRLQSRCTDDLGYRQYKTVGHRRSRSSTGQGFYYHPCGSCGGSGYNLDLIGRSEIDEGLDTSVHSRTISDTYAMPARVIYEYKQTPTIRLPVHQDYNGWTERVYGMQELYGSAVSPQLGRAYNTIGHQPSTGLKAWSNQSQCSWAPGMTPATSSPVLLQKSSRRRTRQYVPSAAQSFYHGDHASFSSSSGEDVPKEPPVSRSLYGRHRHRSCGGQPEHSHHEQEDFSSVSNGAYATARCVTEMAHKLNSKLTRHHSRQRSVMDHHQNPF